MSQTDKRYAPAVQRNKDPIFRVLKGYLPQQGNILEIASGSGEHCVYFASRLPEHMFYPADAEENALASIEAHRKQSRLGNIKPAQKLDVQTPFWWKDLCSNICFGAVLCINMVHIAPWEAAKGLMSGASKCLNPEGLLVLYGPYFEESVRPAPTNIDFDRSLKSKNPEWGIRDISDMIALGRQNSLELYARHEMPANNLTLIFKRI